MLRVVRIRSYQRGLVLRRDELVGLLRPGRHVLFDPLLRTRVETLDIRGTWFSHPRLFEIVRAGLLGSEAEVLELGGFERAIISVDGRVAGVAGPGLAALWTTLHKVEVERYDARSVRLVRSDLAAVLAAPGANEVLQSFIVEPHQRGLAIVDGAPAIELQPGLHAFWKNVAQIRLFAVDSREQTLDLGGQEILTADKVTLRLNAVVNFRVVDPLAAVTDVDDAKQALYRQAQLALRAVVGTVELDRLLAEKDAITAELLVSLREAVARSGVAVGSFGIRDVILPGEMKEILNRVVQAKKAAEASLLTRREEVASARSQANTARIFEANPTLMKLKELEVLEKVAEKAQLTILLGDQGGLSDRVVKML
jgi:regulator of protease activity HflC (stomatin/prohibitin superfamily)